MFSVTIRFPIFLVRGLIRLTRYFLVVSIALWAFSGGVAIACSPPPAIPVVAGPNGVMLPYQEPSYFAFLGKVVGHEDNAAGVPALAVEVLDAWTARQRRGEIVTIAVEQWQGCGLPKPMGERFQPARYPIGTRVRIVSRESTMYTWDVEVGISVLGVAP